MEIRWKSKELGYRIITLVIVFSVLCSLIGSIKSKAETKKRYIVLIIKDSRALSIWRKWNVSGNGIMRQMMAMRLLIA